MPSIQLPQSKSTSGLSTVDAVDWPPGSDVYVTSSSMDYLEGEFATIQAVKDRFINLTQPLARFHHGSAAPEVQGSLKACFQIPFKL